MFYLTIYGQRGQVDKYTFTHSTLMDALMELARINEARRVSGFAPARFSLVRKPAAWQRAG